MPKLSIVISSYRRERYLKNLILSIRNHFPENSYEIIIVSSDNPNSDKIKTISKYKNVKVLTPDLRINKRLHSLYYYENIGIKQCENDWIFITNDDTKFINNFYDEFCKIEKDYDVILIGGHVGNRREGIRIPKIGTLNKPNVCNNDLYLFDFSLIRKSVYEKIEYLDENIDWFGKGLDLSLQIEFLTNSKILYESNLIIDHEIAMENRTCDNETKDFAYLEQKWTKWRLENPGYNYHW